MKTRIRRSGINADGKWVADIVTSDNFAVDDKYIQPNGSIGGFAYYDTAEDAQRAADLWKQKNTETSAGIKDTNPKEALGIKKVPTHCIPTGSLFMLGLAMMEGGRKYGTYNYRAMGARYSTYFDGITRHNRALLEGEDIDPDSGLHHLAKIMGCCAVLLDSILMGNAIDDRPLQYPNGLDMEHYNKLAANIIDKYPDCEEPFTEKNKIQRDGPIAEGC